MSAPLLRLCPDCDGAGVVWDARLGGNDPDGSETVCDRCAGAGEYEATCDCCVWPATRETRDWHGATLLVCDACATEVETA